MARSLSRLVVPLLTGLGVSVLCVSLGMWQLRRADYKETLRARFDAAGAAHPVPRADMLAEWQRVTLRGQWLAEHGALLDNRMRAGQAGYEVLTPLRLDGNGGVVIVNRGWLAGNGDRSRLPPIPTPSGEVELSGVAVAAVPPGFSLAASQQRGPIWQKADLASFERILGTRVGAWLVRQESAAADGLDRAWPAADFGADKHRAYALQWFAMAATALGLSLWHGRKVLIRKVAPAPFTSTTTVRPS